MHPVLKKFIQMAEALSAADGIMSVPYKESAENSDIQAKNVLPKTINPEEDPLNMIAKPVQLFSR